MRTSYGRSDDVQPHVACRCGSDVVRLDAVDISGNARDCREVRSISTDLDIEIAVVQMEIVATGAGVLYDKASHVESAAQVHLQEGLRSGRAPLIVRAGLRSTVECLIRRLFRRAGSTSGSGTVQREILEVGSTLPPSVNRYEPRIGRDIYLSIGYDWRTALREIQGIVAGAVAGPQKPEVFGVKRVQNSRHNTLVGVADARYSRPKNPCLCARTLGRDSHHSTRHTRRRQNGTSNRGRHRELLG